MASIPFQEIEYLSIQLYNFEGEDYDITELVTEFSLFENIHYPFIYGKIGLIDNSGMLPRVPMVGQEYISIVMQITDFNFRLERLFFVGGLENVKPSGTGHAGIILSLLGIEQVNDTNHMFSRSFNNQPVEEIICGGKNGKGIYEEFFNRRAIPAYPTRATTPYNLVVPYTTPLGLISSLLKNTWADDNTPLFLYDTLYSKNIYLKSYKSMVNTPWLYNITPIVSANLDTARGHGSRYIHNRRGLATSYEFPEAYDTYKIMANGGYKHTIHHADYSNKTFEELGYSYKEEKTANILTGDYLTDRFYNEVQFNTMIARRYTNNNAFQTGNNMFATDQIMRSTAEQHMERMKTVTLFAQGSFSPLAGIGNTVKIDIQLNLPQVPGDRGKENNLIDKTNSGSYVVSSIEHKFKRQNDNKYFVVYELIRDGVNNYA